MSIAELGIKVNSTGPARAATNLDKMDAAAIRAERSTVGLTGKTKTLGTSMGVMRANIVGAVAGFAAFAAIRSSVAVLSDFESGMSKVAAVTRATAGELEALRDVAKDLGSTTEFTAAQAASGLAFLGMAGFSAAESISAIPAVLDLATAAAMDLGSAADISSNIMSAFGIAATEAGDVADILAAASSRANTNVGQLGEAMKFVGPIASALDISMNDTAAAIGILSDAGLQGTMAGTGLRRVLSSLVNPTTDAEKALASMGVTIESVNPDMHSIVDIVETLAVAGIDAADALTIFGDRGGPAILALTSQTGDLRELTGELQNVAGEAEIMADIMRDNVGGDITELKSAISGLIIQMGESGLTAIIRIVVQGLTGLVRALTSAAGAFKKFVGLIPKAVDWMDNLNSSQDMYDVTLDNVVQGLADEIVQTQLLSTVLQESTVMSVQAAQEKLKEARARHANAAAAIEEQRALALDTEAYKDATFAYTSALGALNSISERNVDARESQEQNAIRALNTMQMLLQPTAEMAEHLKQSGINMESLAEALDGAAGGFVKLGGDMVEPIENSDLIARAMKVVERKLTETEQAALDLGNAFMDLATNALSKVGDAFRDFASRGFRDFKSFASSVLSTFKRLLIDMMLMAAKNKIMISLGLGGGGSLIGTAASAATGGGVGGVGMLGALGTSVMGGLSGVGMGASAGFAAAGGGLAGIGGAISGGLASTGTIISGGLAAGGVAGIGAAIGAALPIIGIGLALFSLFKKKPPYREKDFNAIQAAIELTNTELLNTSTAGHKAATALKKAFGGLENMQKATESYYNNFFTNEEKRQKAIDAIAGAFESVGLAVPETAGGFRDIVESQDLMTESGRDTYATLLQVSDAFAAVYGGANSVNKALSLMTGKSGVFKTLQDEIFASVYQSKVPSVSISSTPTTNDDTASLLRELTAEVRAGNIVIAKNTGDTAYSLIRTQLEPAA